MTAKEAFPNGATDSQSEGVKQAVVAIVPAAGLGERLGGNKLLLGWGTGTVIETVVKNWLDCPVQQIVFVIREDDEPLANAIDLAAGRDKRLLICRAQSPPDMKASLWWGIREVEKGEQAKEEKNGIVPVTARNDPAALLFAPADLVFLNPAIVEQLIDHFRSSPESCWLPTLNGKRGHPVLIPWSLRNYVRQLGPTQGIRDLWNILPNREVDCDFLPGTELSFCDLDTIEDYRRLSPRKQAP